jgi:hypothetical protein
MSILILDFLPTNDTNYTDPCLIFFASVRVFRGWQFIQNRFRRAAEINRLAACVPQSDVESKEALHCSCSRSRLSWVVNCLIKRVQPNRSIYEDDHFASADQRSHT